MDKETLDRAFDARFPKEIKTRLNDARVAIAGLGGLGSNIAMILARSGVGHMLLVDFDVVDVTNLNRQAYILESINDGIKIVFKMDVTILLGEREIHIFRKTANAMEQPQSSSAIKGCMLKKAAIAQPCESNLLHYFSLCILQLPITFGMILSQHSIKQVHVP